MKTAKKLFGILTITAALSVGTVAQGTQFSSLNLPLFTLNAAANDISNNTYVLSDWCLSQYRPDATCGWTITLNGSVYDCRLNVSSNAVLVSGATDGGFQFVDTTGNSIYIGNGGQSTFLLKFSLEGVALWHASVDVCGGAYGSGVTVDNAGNAYWEGFLMNVCQPTATLTGGDGTTLQLTNQQCGTFLIKMSSAGSFLWAVQSSSCSFDDAVVDKQGNAYVVGTGSGNTENTATVISADGTFGVISNLDSSFEFIAKFNPQGVLQWSVSPTCTNDSYAYYDYNYYNAHPRPISLTSGGDVLFSGSFSSGTLTLPSTDGNNLQLTTASDSEGFITQYSSNGKAKWANTIPISADQGITAICSVSSNIWVGGTTTNSMTISGITLNPTGLQNVFIFQMNTNGQILNGSLLGGTQSDTLASLQANGQTLGLVAGNEGGDFVGLGVSIPEAGPFVLLAPTPPTITSQPQSILVNAHDTASFNVTATGTSPLAYQWLHAGTNLPNATSSTLTIANARPFNIGAYRVVIANNYGAVTSSVANLTLNPNYAGVSGPYLGVSITVSNSLQNVSKYTNGITTTANPTTSRLVATNILTLLAFDERAAGNWPSNGFPRSSTLALASGRFVVVNGNNLLLDVSDIMTFTNYLPQIHYGKLNNSNGLASPSLTTVQMAALAFDDTFISGGKNYQFYLAGVLTQTKTDTTPLNKKYTETITQSLGSGTGDGSILGVPFICTGTFSATASSSIKLNP